MKKLVLFLLSAVFSTAALCGVQSAAQWIEKNSHKSVDQEEALAIANAAFRYSKKYEVDPYLLIGLMKAESSFKSDAKSSYGAIGLAQVVPRWHPEKVKGKDLASVSDNIEIAIQILLEYKYRDGDLRKTLNRYSGGATGYYEKVMRHRSSLLKYIGSENDVQVAQVKQKAKPPKVPVAEIVIDEKSMNEYILTILTDNKFYSDDNDVLVSFLNEEPI